MLDTFTRLCCHKQHHGILVLGEGNFSFSVDLAEYEMKTSLHVTSFDSYEVVHADNFAVENVTTLETRDNVTVMHSVDATNLEKSFPNTKFSVIIFNFPHTGGKSNIRKCRKLLEDLFRSSLSCLCDEGRVIISLCKGQGGTPTDASRGNYGNSWKVVSCASKSGFILRHMIPFDNSNLTHYRTAGYRGVIRQNFFTVNGLVHIFEKGADIDASSLSYNLELVAESTCESIQKYMFDEYMKIKENNLLNCMDTILSNSLIDTLPECVPVHHDQLLSLQNEKSLLELFLDIDSFKFSYFNLNESLITDINPYSFYFSHGVMFSLKLETIDDEGAFKHIILQTLQKELFKNYQVDIVESRSISTCNSTHKITSKLCKPYLKKFSDEKEYDFDNVPNFIDDIPVSFWTNFEPEIVVSSRQEGTNEIIYEKKTCQTYELNKLEEYYFSIDSDDCHSSFELKNIKKFLINGVCVGCMFDYEDQNGANRFVVQFNTNELFHVMGVQDLRYLWSNDEIYKVDILKVFQNVEDQTINSIPPAISQFNTLIKHPLCYRHDLCFWLDEKHREKDLMESIRFASHGYLHSVRLIKVLRHEETDCVSYCYRMIYSRLDGPMSHEDSVQLQNDLRLYLLDQGYNLR